MSDVENNIDSALKNLQTDKADSEVTTNADTDVEQQVIEEPKITEIQQERDDWKDKALRAMAETENIRRLASKEKQELKQNTIKSVCKDLLLVIDTFERALVDKTEEDADNFLQGIFLTYKELQKSLEKQDIKKIETTIGQSFDHNFHQAMGYVESDDIVAGDIVQVIQSGYTIGNILLRPALVMLAKETNNK